MATPTSYDKSVRSLLLQHYPHLRPAEKKVAAFLLHHAHSGSELSLEQLATCSGASRSAVVRMCQALGLKGFRSFQLMWAKEAPLRSTGTETTSTSAETTLVPNKPPIFEPILNEFFKTEEILDRHAMERAAQTILASQHLAICGNAGLSIAAQLANLWFRGLVPALRPATQRYFQERAADNPSIEVFLNYFLNDATAYMRPMGWSPAGTIIQQWMIRAIRDREISIEEALVQADRAVNVELSRP